MGYFINTSQLKRDLVTEKARVRARDYVGHGRVWSSHKANFRGRSHVSNARFRVS